MNRVASVLVLLVLTAGQASARPGAADIDLQEPVDCPLPTIDDRCEVSTSPMRGQVFPLDVAASASRVFSAITGGRVRGTDAATGAFSWETQLGAGVPGTFVTSVGVSPGGAGVFAGGTIGSSPTVTRLDPSTGAIAWSTTVPGVRTAGGELAVSADGKVVALTGNDNDQGRITTIGFDAATGDVLWRGDSDVPGSELVFGNTISPDGSTVFAVGQVTDPSTSRVDALVVAFRANETEERADQAWVSTIDRGPWDVYFDAAVTPDGSTVFATGSSDTSGGLGLGYSAEMIVVALSADDGSRRWVTARRGSAGYNEGASLAVSGDRIFVAGTSSSTQKEDESEAAVVAFDQSGNAVWTSLYGQLGVDDERFFGVVASPDGSKVFATGVSGTTPSVSGTSMRVGDAVTAAFSSSTGAQLWAARYRDPDNTGSRDAGIALAMSPDGSRVHVLAHLSTSRFSTDVPSVTSFRNEAAVLTYAA